MVRRQGEIKGEKIQQIKNEKIEWQNKSKYL